MGLLKKRVLFSALLVMLFNSIYQYSWNVFALYLKSYGLSVLFLEAMFFSFVFMSTLLQILGGYVSDVKGPRAVGLSASILSAFGYLALLKGEPLALRLLLWSSGSAGEGMLYGIATNSALKWHKEERGLAVGIVSLGFGAGAAIFNPLFLSMKNLQEISLLMFFLEILILPVLSLSLTYPKGLSGKKPREAVLSLPFLLIYISYSLGVVPLLSLSSSLFLLRSGFSLALAIVVFPLMSGLGRPFMGRLSDKIGRFKAIYLSLSLIALGSVLGELGLPIIPESMIGLLDGSLIPLYFSLLTDLMGEAYSASLTSVLYTGKTAGAVLGSFAEGYLAKESVAFGWLLMLSSSLASLATFFALTYLIEKRKR